jgi:hypothetical protein
LGSNAALTTTSFFEVEYWLFQAQCKAKINAERIARLESIGFEWDPQRGKYGAYCSLELVFFLFRVRSTFSLA